MLSLLTTFRAAGWWLLLLIVLQWHGGGVVRGASYRPGIAPRTYTLGEDIPLLVDALTSTKTQIPMDYYRLPFCQPEGGPMMEAQSTGQFMEGSRIQTSPFRVNMAMEGYCRKLCQVTYSNLQYEKVKWHVEKRYHYNWMLDHLPAATIGSWHMEQYANGFPIGVYDEMMDQIFLLNHFNLVIDYHRIEPSRADQETSYRVVEFAVQPFSVEHQFASNSTSWDDQQGYNNNKLITCPDGKVHFSDQDIRYPQKLGPDQPILFTYDVIWRDSEKPWSERWEIYLTNDNWVPMRIHWYSVTNSTVALVFLTMLLAALWVRVTKPPSAQNNNNPQQQPISLSSMTMGTAWRLLMARLRNHREYASLSGDEAMAAAARSVEEERALQEARQRQEERNWRRLHGDVFRPPSTWPSLFCALIGTGVQLTVACFGVVILAAWGVVSQAVPGTIPNAFLVMFNLSGVVSGYVSYRLCASFGGGPSQLKRVAKMVALIIPTCVYGSFLVLNVALAFRQSTASLPVIDLLILLAGWLCGLIPMVFLGAYIAGLRDVMEYPTHTDPVPRPIPTVTCWKKPLVTIPIAGILVFGALYVELFFAMSSLWQRQYYYVFRVALVVYGVSMLTSGVTSALMVYFQLACENHRWWWYSLFCGGSVGFYVACYACLYTRSLQLDESFVTYLVYMTYMFWISVGTFLIFGSFGFFSALFFLLRLYSTLEPDQIEAEEAVNRNEDESAGYIMLDSMARTTSADDDGEDQGTTASANQEPSAETNRPSTTHEPAPASTGDSAAEPLV